MTQRRLLWCVVVPVIPALLFLFAPGGARDAPASTSVHDSDPGPLEKPDSMPPARASLTRAVGPAGRASPLVLVDEAATAREVERRRWVRRLDRARYTLDSYLEATRYPPDSRPISEHPDQVRPSAPERKVPLDPEGEGEVMIVLRQEKVYVVGREMVHFFVRCEDPDGQPLPCEVVSALAHEAPHRAAAGTLTAVPLRFSDDGTGTLVARFQPANDGFPLYEGTLRVEIKVRSGAVDGGALFDVIYTPAAPATFTGAVREAMRNGSLELSVALDVRKPGRYVITGRVDDATGTPFALLTFNEELARGRQEAKLTLFGRLVLDQHPVPPFTLRDVEGFLLRESGDPDREVLSAMLGPVHTTRVHPESAFSGEEWQSEERERHVKEFTRDLEHARHTATGLRGGPEESRPTGPRE